MTFYRKKKRKVGPSKNDEKVRRGQDAAAQADAAGTLSSRFPGVRGLKLRIAVTSLQNVVLSDEEEQLGPNDPFQIAADCPGRCGSGSFDFAPLVAEKLSAGAKSGEAALSCAESAYGGAADQCGCTAKLTFAAS